MSLFLVKACLFTESHPGPTPLACLLFHLPDMPAVCRGRELFYFKVLEVFQSLCCFYRKCASKL